MNIIATLNIIALLASILWIAFEPGFEPVIVSLASIVTLITLAVKLSKHGNTNTLELVPRSGDQKVEVKNCEPTEVEKVASRFRQILLLINEKNSYDPFTIGKLSKALELQTIGELERIFNAKEEPSFEFISKFSDTLGVNEDWLAYGHKHPFTDDDVTNPDPLGYLSEIKALKPESIYFILNNSDVAETFILLKLSELKYKLFQRTWHISSHVGNGGRNQIYSFYKLIINLKRSGFSSKCHGRILEPEIFNRLLIGDVYPETVLQYMSEDSSWWDDFTDVQGRYVISQSYQKWYGEEFCYAQGIVRDKLMVDRS